MSHTEQFYKVADICRLLGISRATFYRRLGRNEIDPPVRDGGLVRWPESSIIKYQDRLRAQA